MSKPKITPQNKYSILDTMKDPIIIELEKDKLINNEQDLETAILAKLQIFFRQLGEGFALIDHHINCIITIKIII